MTETAADGWKSWFLGDGNDETNKKFSKADEAFV